MHVERVQLTDEQARFVQNCVANGRYGSTSEVVRAAIRLLQQQEQEDKLKLRILRRIASDSFARIERGEYKIVDLENLDEFMDRMDADSRRR